jgi:ABC-type dipeptide/oligopeptide/nickel transport system permease component
VHGAPLVLLLLAEERDDMVRYFTLRILGIIPTVFLSLFIVFSLAYLAPGDPITRMYLRQEELNPGVTVSDEYIERMKERYGLNRPYHERFLGYLANLSRGDFGRSIVLGVPVLPTILAVLPISAQVGMWSFLLIVVFGIPLGVITALRKNTWIDYLTVGSSLALRTVPVFVTAPLLILLLVLKLDIMKVPYGWHGMFSHEIIMPALFLAVGPVAGVIRQTRAGVLETLGQDYVRTARAKGLTLRAVISRHILRTALLPVVTGLGMTITSVVTGSLFLETIFGIPGYGQLSVRALRSLDYPMIMGTTLVGAALIMISNVVVDFIYPLLDPRVVYD